MELKQEGTLKEHKIFTQVFQPYPSENEPYAMKGIKEWIYKIYVFFTSAMVGGEWSASCHGRIVPGKEPTVLIRLGGPVTGLDGAEKGEVLMLRGLEL
jgi:hypothetical protein